MSALSGLSPAYGVLTVSPSGSVSVVPPGPAGASLVSGGANAAPSYASAPVVWAPEIGIVMDGVTDNSAALNNIPSVLPRGGTVEFPPGTCVFASPWDLDQRSLLRFVGAGSNQPGSGACTTLLYTGNGSASAISCRAGRGLKFEALSPQWNQSGFTGYLMDFGKCPSSNGDTVACCLDDCNLRPANDSLTGAAALLNLGWTYRFYANRCSFRGGQYNVIGGVDSTLFNNTILFNGCDFANAVRCAVKNWLQSWEFHTCEWEPLASGAAGAFTYDPSIGPPLSWGPFLSGLVLVNPWMGDDSGSVQGAWITLGIHCTTILGGTIGCNALTTGILYGASALTGLTVNGVTFVGDGGSSKGIDFGTTTGNSGFASFGCKTYNLSQFVAGNVPSDSIYQSGGTLFFGALTCNVLNVAGAQNHPNMLTATQADFESGATTGWGNNIHATLATTTAAACNGDYSLSVTNNDNSGTTTEVSINSFSGLVACAPGQTWTALASFLMPAASTGRRLTIAMGAADSNHANLTTLASSTAAFRDNSTNWQQHVLSGVTVPATISNGAIPAVLYLFIRWTDTAPAYIPLGEAHYVDCVSLSQSSSTNWQNPTDSSATLTVTPTALQFSSSGSVLSSGNGTIAINHGAGAGTGGTILGLPVTQE